MLLFAQHVLSTKSIITLQRGQLFARSRRRWKALIGIDEIRTDPGHGSRCFRERWVTVLLSVLLSCLWISKPGVRVSLVAGSAAAGRAARVVLFVFVVVNALRVVVVDCVDDLQGIESFKTRPGSMSESSPLESYAIFRDFVFAPLGPVGPWRSRTSE